MSNTTVTVTSPLKAHLETIKQERGLSSLNEVIQSVLENPVDSQYEIPDANTRDNPAGIKISTTTLEWLKGRKQASEYNNYEDFLRHLTGASSRQKGEQPIEWEPL